MLHVQTWQTISFTHISYGCAVHGATQTIRRECLYHLNSKLIDKFNFLVSIPIPSKFFFLKKKIVVIMIFNLYSINLEKNNKINKFKNTGNMIEISQSKIFFIKISFIYGLYVSKLCLSLTSKINQLIEVLNLRASPFPSIRSYFFRFVSFLFSMSFSTHQKEKCVLKQSYRKRQVCVCIKLNKIVFNFIGFLVV